MPSLVDKENIYKGDDEKATLFAKNLFSTFSNSPNDIYDNEWKIKVDKYILSNLEDFLDQRYFMVKVNNSFSCKYRIYNGVPQGCILRPILSSVYSYYS
jgi:hypothetical protein